MSKYDGLRDYLRRQTSQEFDLSFEEIERLTGHALPKSAERPQWWANVRITGTHVQREAWRAAGYGAFLISGSRRVRFRRVR